MPKLLQIWRVAEVLDCAKSTVYSLIQQGELIAVKLGKRGIRVYATSLNAYLLRHQVDNQK